MTRIGRRMVPQSTIERRVQAKDDRIAAELREKYFPVVLVVDVALVPDPAAPRGPVVECALVPTTPHKSFPKPSTRVTRAIAQSAVRLLDRRKLVAWSFAVKSRDQWRDRKTGVRLLRTLNLDPLRAEAYHVVSRDDRAVRYDVRNGITLSLVTHDAVERGLYRIEGTAWFTVQGTRCIDASSPVRFVRT